MILLIATLMTYKYQSELKSKRLRRARSTARTTFWRTLHVCSPFSSSPLLSYLSCRTTPFVSCSSPYCTSHNKTYLFKPINLDVWYISTQHIFFCCHSFVSFLFVLYICLFVYIFFQIQNLLWCRVHGIGRTHGRRLPSQPPGPALASFGPPSLVSTMSMVIET